MINGKRARMTRQDAERQESSAAGKQLPSVFGSVFHSAILSVSARVGGSLPEQTDDVMKLNARAVCTRQLVFIKQPLTRRFEE